MTQHTELIERLRQIGLPMAVKAANALEAQAREIVELKAQLEVTAKNAFEAMPHDIPRRMKREICVNAAWSGSMVSRMYTELRKAFTGEPYKANEDLDAARLEVARLQAARMAYASEFPPDAEGEPDVGSIHQNIRAMKAEIERLRKDAAMLDFLEAEYWGPNPIFKYGHLGANLDLATVNGVQSESLRDAIDAAIRALNTEGEGNDRP